MKKEGILTLVSLLLFLSVLPFVVTLNVGLCVNAEVSDISPSSIKIGDEFTIGIHIENCGTILPQNVSFEILSLPADISVKEPLIIQIPKIQYANSERFIVFHMKLNNEAESGTYVIKTRLSSGGEMKMIKDNEILINVIGDKAELSVASVKISPVLPYKGDTTELTLRIENTGKGTAKSVEIYADHPFQGIKKSFIGALDANEDGPIVLTFIADKVGEFEIPIIISYKDDFGINEIQKEINLTILKKKINWGLIIFTIAIIAFAIWGFKNYTKLKRSKNKIIHQLLGGEKDVSSSEEKETQIKKVRSPKETTQEKKEREKKERRRKEFKREILKKYKK